MLNGLVVDRFGNKRWYKNDKIHRIDGPAIEYYGGNKAWYKNDKIHRIDGPAFEYSDGTKGWWMHGAFVGYDDIGFWALWDRLTDEQRSNLNLLMHLPKVI